MSCRLRRPRAVRVQAARILTHAARRCSGAGRTAGVAAVVVVLGSWLVTPAASAQIAVARTPRAAGAAVAWAGFAANAQHTAVARQSAQPFHRIRWRAKVDLNPALTHHALFIHYGSPMISAANTVLVPTRVSKKAGFRVVAYSGTSGKRRWSLNTDYRPPAIANGVTVFTPPLPAALTSRKALAVAGAGGTVLLRGQVNKPTGAVRRLVFYGERSGRRTSRPITRRCRSRRR
jgi:hypothetical protein